MNPKSTRQLSARSGLEVSVLGYGCGPIGDQYMRHDNDRAIGSVTEAHEAGVTLYDTLPH
jgi:aryl-alcohol dehydrogenase-like predicted oxidoreductase